MSGWRLSSRLPEDWSVSRDMARIQSALRDRRSEHLPVDDLTVSSPWNAGLMPDLRDIVLRVAEDGSWSADPRGSLKIREMLASLPSYRSCAAHPREYWLTTGTSESYSHLFRLWCDPGDTVLVGQPGYPLLENLAGLDRVRPEYYFYEQNSEGYWEIRWDLLSVISDRARIFLIVDPANPIGSVLREAEWLRLGDFCRERGLALVVDEVFSPYRRTQIEIPWDALCAQVPVFRLDGVSKRLGMPQLKLGWIWFRGPRDIADRVADALDYIADTYLTVSAAAQEIAMPLLQRQDEFQMRVHQRIERNLEILREAWPRDLLSPVLGGWYACLRCAGLDSAELSLRLVREHGILTHPAYLYDFHDDDWLIVSLLVNSERFSEAMRKIRQVVFGSGKE